MPMAVTHPPKYTAGSNNESMVGENQIKKKKEGGESKGKVEEKRIGWPFIALQALIGHIESPSKKRQTKEQVTKIAKLLAR